MNWLNMFLKNKVPSAQIAKERLKIIVQHQRLSRSNDNFLPEIEKDILLVIKKYVEVQKENISVKIDNNARFSTLEVNVQIPK